MNRLLAPIESAMKWLVIVLTGGLLFWVFIQVITRYCFGYTPSFGEELARYMFVWIVFLSMPLVAKSGGHMAIETIAMWVKGPTRKFVNLVADIFTMIFLLLMVWEGFQMVMRVSYQTTPAMEISMSYVYMVIPFGCLVMLLNTIANFVTLLRTPADELK